MLQPKNYTRAYLDNDLYLADAQDGVFVDPEKQAQVMTAEEAARIGKHVSNLRIVVIKGYPYYDDERLKEFRRVGEPSFVLTYDQFDLLPERDQRLTIPRGEEFRKVMEKEASYWQRRRNRDGDRG
ncbi:hypothetical protein [Hyphomicrobium sp.]|uniref:hypothetical protein n=1 Tax=Hyphomicrobium sp. TaxID=82 RepID=UPI002E32EA22|nr:hypothetical protein [Hyphomicrobium sp.]HEX2842059.1 hypothetical protein [Hyphomicrobium sp.]